MTKHRQHVRQNSYLRPHVRVALSSKALRGVAAVNHVREQLGFRS